MLGLFKKSQKATDPVCLMKVNMDENALSYSHEGETYYFCSESCKEQFKQDPQNYLS